MTTNVDLERLKEMFAEAHYGVDTARAKAAFDSAWRSCFQPVYAELTEARKQVPREPTNRIAIAADQEGKD